MFVAFIMSNVIKVDFKAKKKYYDFTEDALFEVFKDWEKRCQTKEKYIRAPELIKFSDNLDGSPYDPTRPNAA